MVRAFVGEIAWVVELSELVDGESNEARLLCVITGRLVDDDDVEVGLVVPTTQGAGAEEDGAIHGGLGYEVPAEGDGVWVGSGVADRRHLVADAVSPHRWHGGTVQPGRGRALF